MKMKQCMGIFLIMSSCLFAEIREITPLSEFSSVLLGETVQKNTKPEKVISHKAEEKKSVSTMSGIPKHSRNISQKDTSQFVDISEQTIGMV